MSKHMALLLTAVHGAAEARSLLQKQKTITDAGEAAEGPIDGDDSGLALPIALRAAQAVKTGIRG